MEIFNEIKQNDDKEKQKFVHRSLAEVQRAKLDKLMKNPEKPVIIPESTKRDKEYNAPSFVRNVMGSSAGAGSGEFHVYRHLRRKEYARQKNLKMQSETERLNDEYQQRLEDNQMKAEERTNKKRAKRQKRKLKGKGKKPKLDEASDKSEESEGEDGSGSDNKESSEAPEIPDTDSSEALEGPTEMPAEDSSEATAEAPQPAEKPTEAPTATEHHPE